MLSDEEMTEEEQFRAIEMQFQHIYKNDAELRRALARSDVASLGVEEKYQIIESYMHGGARGLQAENEDEDDDEEAIERMSADDKAIVEAQFRQLYSKDADLR